MNGPPRSRTWAMSALGHKRTFRSAIAMSASPQSGHQGWPVPIRNLGSGVRQYILVDKNRNACVYAAS